MPPNKPTSAGASAANAAANGDAGAGGGIKKSQDEHTAADYYFDSYSHFGKREDQEEGGGEREAERKGTNLSP
jgi:hypothetical protein